ncbi:DUF4369 domain-containing protein [Maribacter sp. 2307ULW6-5]|uniref:DUF4369 domain-containing protein n=1 Tax=Maribacter sp. 2307ULW6-5 TaxID=3386275 RepID=UPI0039BD7856
MNGSKLFLLSCLLLGCANREDGSRSVRFAGEIVNPTSDHVVLLKGRHVLDSAMLDGQNRFSFELDSLEDGLYNFKHAREYQYVFLEQGDSLQIRLNTTDFDESLVFSGENEEVNNFLLELFLANEEVERSMYTTHFDLGAEDFSREVERLRSDKIQSLNELLVETPLSEKAQELLRSSIDYSFYRFKEIYPFEHKRKLKESTLHKMPNDFYDYRKTVNYNNERLVYLRPYYEFMKSHFGNISYMSCAADCGGNGEAIRNKLHFHKHKLHVIDSLVKEKELRDNLFRNVAINYLLMEHDVPENNDAFIAAFEKVSHNNEHAEEIHGLYEAVQNIMPNNPLPDVALVDASGDTLSIASLAKNHKAIYYFWSTGQKNHYRELFKQVGLLRQQHPDHRFIGICLNTEPGRWQAVLNEQGMDQTTQYRAANHKETTEKLVVWPMNKCIVVNNGLVVNGFANIYHPF